MWTGPTAPPTGNNVEAPVNIGPTAQIKTGDLTVGNLTLTGSTIKPSSQSNAGGLFLNYNTGLYTAMMGNSNSWVWYVNNQTGDTYTKGTATIAGGSPAAGKVLTATNVNGDATWQTPAGSGSSLNAWFYTAVGYTGVPAFFELNGNRYPLTGGSGAVQITNGGTAVLPPGKWDIFVYGYGSDAPGSGQSSDDDHGPLPFKSWVFRNQVSTTAAPLNIFNFLKSNTALGVYSIGGSGQALHGIGHWSGHGFAMKVGD